MTEAEWLTCNDLKRMLRLVRVKRRERKLRLFAVACCRRVWDLLTDERCRDAVAAAERLADGQITSAEVLEHREAAYRVAHARPGYTGQFKDLDLPAMAVAGALRQYSGEFSRSVYEVAGLARKEYYSRDEYASLLASETDLLREIFGNPYRTAYSPSPAIFVLNAGAVRKITEVIYEEHAFDHLPILADALEEAGCENDDVLSHCRSKGTHVRGCWVVDLLLGKE